MELLNIKCASCSHVWAPALPFSVYEQQAMESCPCPNCGAYTLCCEEPAPPAGRRKAIVVMGAKEG